MEINMKFYKLEPEIAGEIGESSKIEYENGTIKKIIFLEYLFSDWLGDELLSTHPCHIVTENLKKDISANNLTGVKFQKIKKTFSDEFIELNISTDIPEFVQIVCDNFYEDKNENALQDFYVNRYKELIVSESALKVIKKHTLNNCLIEEI